MDLVTDVFSPSHPLTQPGALVIVKESLALHQVSSG